MPLIVASYDISLECQSAPVRSLDACSFCMRLIVRSAHTFRSDHADLIKQGSQVARAPDQRVETIRPMHELSSGTCWPPHARILVHFLASPVLDLVLPAANTCSMTFKS